MTRTELAHLDARYRALLKNGSAAAEQAFRDWRRAAVTYAEERRSVDLAGDLVDEDGRGGLPEVFGDELADVEVLIGGGVLLEPGEELGELSGHAPIFEQDQPLHQSRFFSQEVP